MRKRKGKQVFFFSIGGKKSKESSYSSWSHLKYTVQIESGFHRESDKLVSPNFEEDRIQKAPHQGDWWAVKDKISLFDNETDFISVPFWCSCHSI